MSVYNTTVAIKNLGLEPIFDVMKMLDIKNRVSVVGDAIKLAYKIKEKKELESHD